MHNKPGCIQPEETISSVCLLVPFFFLLHSSNGKRKKKRKKPSERRPGKGSWRGAVMRVEEKSGLQDGCSFEKRRSIFFK